MRMTFDALVPRLLGEGDEVPVYVSHWQLDSESCSHVGMQEKAKNKSQTIGPTLHFDFKWDPHLRYLIAEEEAYETDVLILSTVGSPQGLTRTAADTLHRAHIKRGSGTLLEVRTHYFISYQTTSHVCASAYVSALRDVFTRAYTMYSEDLPLPAPKVLVISVPAKLVSDLSIVTER